MPLASLFLWLFILTTLYRTSHPLASYLRILGRRRVSPNNQTDSKAIHTPT